MRHITGNLDRRTFTLIGGGGHLIGFVMWRYRIQPRGLIAMIGALVYLASPVDVLPEVMLGPLGLLDDAGAATAAGSSSTSS